MTIQYLIIPREDEKQTYDSVFYLPRNVQRQLALYEVSSDNIAEYMNAVKGIPPVNPAMLEIAKPIMEAFNDKDNFIIGYEDDEYDVATILNEGVNLDINGEVILRVIQTDEGYVFDVYSKEEFFAEDGDEVAEPVASTWVHNNELTSEE